MIEEHTLEFWSQAGIDQQYGPVTLFFYDIVVFPFIVENQPEFSWFCKKGVMRKATLGLAVCSTRASLSFFFACVVTVSIFPPSACGH